MVSPVAGTAATSEVEDEPKSDKAQAKKLARQARNLGERLARIETAGDAQ
jgi:hypothetical protein